MLSELLNWWVKQVLDLVPPTIRSRADGAPDACIISVEGHSETAPLTVRLGTRRTGQIADLGRFVLDATGMDEARSILRKHDRRHAVAVRVPGDVLLERTIALPLAAEADLASVLRYEMDSITPFAVEELFWTWSVVRRDRERRRLYIRLSFVPKMALPSLSAALEGLGTAPSWLEAATPTGAPRVIPLGHMAASEQRRRRNLRFGLGATAVLMIACIVLPFILQSMAQMRVEDRINALAPSLRLAETLRSRITRDSSAATLIAAEHGRVGDPLAVLSAVTAALPDDTFLTDLSIREGRLEITGESKAAAKLIAVLAASPTLKDPAFIASVTHAENGSDAFSIRAGIAH
jgi:general secretion pathway protein L